MRAIENKNDGSTPLGFGIRTAAESLPQFSFNSKIYVITDGNYKDVKFGDSLFKDSPTGNCGENVCKVFKEFQNKKFGFGVTVVPFEVVSNNPLLDSYRDCGIKVEPPPPQCFQGEKSDCISPFLPFLPVIIILSLVLASILITIWILKVRKQQTVMFMLDVSGSMANNDRTERRKIDVAREAFKEIISLMRNSPSSKKVSQKVGFVAFGGNCGELREKPINPAYDNLRTIENALDNHDYCEPKGSTPLAFAIQEVTTILKKQKERERYLNWLKEFTPVIILITDGSDTCEGDPVSEIQEAKKQGIDFIIIIIAYSINQQESEHKVLPQIAHAAINGYYFSADTEKDLQDRVQQSVAIQKTKNVDLKKGKLKGKLQLINKSQNNITKWELWQTNISPDLAVMQAIDAGDHEVCVGDYDLRVYFNDGRTEYCKKVSVRQNKPTVVEIV